MYILSKQNSSSTLLGCYFHLIDLNDIFIIKNSSGYRRVLLAIPTVTSPNWISVFLM